MSYEPQPLVKNTITTQNISYHQDLIRNAELNLSRRSQSETVVNHQESEKNREKKTFISSPNLHAMLHENLLNLLRMKNSLLNHPNHQQILPQQNNSNISFFKDKKNIIAKTILQSKIKHKLNEFEYKKIDIEKYFQEADDVINKKVRFFLKFWCNAKQTMKKIFVFTFLLFYL
jgi:hypothetical protein